MSTENEGGQLKRRMVKEIEVTLIAKKLRGGHSFDPRHIFMCKTKWTHSFWTNKIL